MRHTFIQYLIKFVVVLSPSLEHAAYDVQVVEDCQEDQQLVEYWIHLSLKNKFKLERKTKMMKNSRHTIKTLFFFGKVRILSASLRKYVTPKMSNLQYVQLRKWVTFKMSTFYRFFWIYVSEDLTLLSAVNDKVPRSLLKWVTSKMSNFKYE